MLNKYRSIILVMAVLTVGGCESKIKTDQIRYSEKKSLMGTVIQLDVCLSSEDSGSHKEAYQQVWGRLIDISWRMNVYDQRSDVTKVNQSQKEPVQIGQDTYDLIKRAIDYHAQTQGAFLISIRPLIDLWYQSQKDEQAPDEQHIKDVLRSIDLKDIILLPDHRIKRNNDKITLDLGGIAKGYAVDEAAKIFRQHGLQSFYIDAGGDVYVGGLNCEGNLWRIGIRDPRENNKIIDTVQLTNMAVTTSGNYEQYFVIKGEKWSHIIDPTTGYPQKEVVSATVIDPSAEVADVYATALTVLGAQKGTSLINGMSMESLIFTKDQNGRLHRAESKEFKKFRLK